MKRVGVLIVIVLVIMLALPVSNLILGAPQAQLTEKEGISEETLQAFEILGAKCVNCHIENYKLPFYAKLPVAKGLIQKDIEAGLAYMDYEKAFSTEGAVVSEVVLAKTEQTILDGSMPPAKYKALHWDGGLSASEKEALLNWIYSTREKQYSTQLASEAYKQDIVQPIPTSHSEAPEKVALGNALYHDNRLSGDNTLACAGCHALAKGGCDQVPFSTGVREQLGGINAPTTFNSGFQFLQFWDGRAADLAAQADGPPNNPIEMDSNWEQIIEKLQQDEAFTTAFAAVYPEGYSAVTLTDAIAAFERTLITPNSGLDRFLMGDDSALNAQEQRGYELFKENKCATCHVGKLMGGQSFEKMGLKADYFGDRGTEITDADLGRFNVTKEEADKHKLKVPTLRNIALTYPYFHDGSTSDLVEAVEQMAKYQVGVNLSKDEAEAIAALLKQCTGEYNGTML